LGKKVFEFVSSDNSKSDIDMFPQMASNLGYVPENDPLKKGSVKFI